MDSNLAQKIECGEFVDLEKLLIRNQVKWRDYDRLEFITHEGQTYLAPAGGDREPKVNGIRRWDQAFRVYVAIYSKANPHHAAEIWQYIHVINTAASNYIWENVAYYDFTFRQMMGKNPNRSWAKLFGQLWNLAMCNLIDRNRQNYQNYQGTNPGSVSKQGSNRQTTGKRPCWKFNKNLPCEPNCDFECKYSYCGSYTHSVLNCYKLHGKKKDNQHGGHANGCNQNSNNNNSTNHTNHANQYSGRGRKPE